MPPNKAKAVVSIVQIHSAKIRSINVTCFRLAKVPLARGPLKVLEHAFKSRGAATAH